MGKSIKTDQSFKLPVWYTPVLIALIACVVFGYLLLSGWGGYAWAYVKCGGKQPLIARSLLSKTKTYHKPGDSEYAPPKGGIVGFKGYYCTESEAQADRVWHSEY